MGGQREQYVEGVVFARVKSIADSALTIELPDGALGQVPINEVFVSESPPIVLGNSVCIQPVVIGVAQRIPVLPVERQTGLFSRRLAVQKAIDAVREHDIVSATICDLSSRYILSLADAGFEIRLPRGQTEEALKARFERRRLGPNREPEEQWLYIQDRIQVRIAERLPDSMLAGDLVIRGTPVAREHPASVELDLALPKAPPSPFARVLIVDDDLEAVEALVDYFRDGGYRTEWEVDPAGVMAWRDNYIRELALERSHPQQGGRPQDTGKKGLLLTVVAGDSPRLNCCHLCELLAELPTTETVIAFVPGASSNKLRQDLQPSQASQYRVVGWWDRRMGLDSLESIIVGQSTSARAGKPSTTDTSSSPLSGPIPAHQEPEDIGGHSLEDNCQRALEPLVEAADETGGHCAAMLFQIHRRNYVTSMVAGCGNEAIVKGFRGYQGHLHKSPVRDLAIFRHRSDTDNAKEHMGRYLYFLDAVGGPEKNLSVRGIRPVAPPGSPLAFAAFLVSPRQAAFRGNTRLTKRLLEAARRSIEVALLAATQDERIRRLSSLAERATDYRYMAHEAARYLEGPSRTLRAHDPSLPLVGDDVPMVRRNVLRTWAIMDQMLPDRQIEDGIFSPNDSIRDFLNDCIVVEKAASIATAFEERLADGLTLRGRGLAFDCVFRNVVLNAIQQIKEYCNGTGTVRVRAYLTTEKTGRKNLVVLVSDDGPGIHHMLWDAIFQGGISTRAAGTGLGLTLSRRLLRDAGGTLELVDSFLYTGTSFRMTIPVNEGP